MPQVITIEEKILRKNSEIAGEIRRRFDDLGVFVVSLVGSPGSGKTSLIERSLPLLRERLRVAVIEGDVQTDRDALRIGALDVPVVQIITNGTCHLEARMIETALSRLDLAAADLLLLENVGNLVCPASYDLGEHLRVIVLSTPEGADKPLKYPALFTRSHGLVINKVDLLPWVRFDVSEARRFALSVNSGIAICEASCETGAGIGEWVDWLCAARSQRFHSGEAGV